MSPVAPTPQPDHPAESEHRGGADSWLRAAVFGASDGLVSNAALVLGVAVGGAGEGGVLLAGVAGLVAGAASMAAGEWISVTAQRESLQRELDREREHLRRFPAAERAHIEAVLREAGLTGPVAARVAGELEAAPERNLAFHARVELGIDPDALGSPGRAAAASFLSFTGGAAVPLAPWMVGGEHALAASVCASALAAFGVGALLSRYTARSAVGSGLRQLAVAAAAAAVTVAVGLAFGVAVA